MNIKLMTNIFSFVLSIILIFVLSIFFYPETNQMYTGWYGWVMGGLHGSLVIPNWFISLFDQKRLIKGLTISTWYNLNWWCGFIFSSYKIFLSPIVGYFVNRKN